MKATSCQDLSSDHSPVLISLNSDILCKEKLPSLCNRRTDWTLFREILSESIGDSLPLKTPEDVNFAAERIAHLIQNAAWQSTPSISQNKDIYQLPTDIKRLIEYKRRLRRTWQTTRLPSDKNRLNRVTKQLQRQLQTYKNTSIKKYLEELSPTENTDYSLWKATRKIKQPKERIPPIRTESGNWARSDLEKCNEFASHFSNIFQPFPAEISEIEEAEIYSYLEKPHQMDLPMKLFKISEVSKAIQDLNPKKSPGYDLITGQVLKQLNNQIIRHITQIFNAILRLEVFPDSWKVAQIILIQKPGKPAEELTSYRPISLLPIISKLFEKLFLNRFQPILERNMLIPTHQFGFRNQHSTIEQVHRVADVIRTDLESKRYCSAAFLDITQAFDKVWHTGLLYKLKQRIPPQFYQIIKSYMDNRFFQIKLGESISNLHPITSGVPQGSVLGPVLYVLFTSDLPTTNYTTTATFADDTVILASHSDATEASNRLQRGLNEIQTWQKKWRLKTNETKSTHVTFTMRRATCPPVTFNNNQLPQSEDAKYLGMHLDRRLTWRKHIWTKRKQLRLKYNKLHWLLGRKSQLSLENKILIYKTILKPIWTYGIQLWGSASTSNIEILQRFQSKTLRSITNAPWFVSNKIIHNDLNIETIKSEISAYSERYQNRLSCHPNELAVNLLNATYPHRLKRSNPLVLPSRFQ